VGLSGGTLKREFASIIEGTHHARGALHPHFLTTSTLNTSLLASRRTYFVAVTEDVDGRRGRKLPRPPIGVAPGGATPAALRIAATLTWNAT
jgi:hypothetical protein